MANLFTNIKDPNKIDWKNLKYTNPATVNPTTQPKISATTGTELQSTIFGKPYIPNQGSMLGSMAKDVFGGFTNIIDQYKNPSETTRAVEELAFPKQGQGKGVLGAVEAPGIGISKAFIRTFSPMLEPFGSDIAQLAVLKDIMPKVESGEIPSNFLEEFDILKKTAPQIVGDVAQSVLAVYSPTILKGSIASGLKSPISQAMVRGGVRGMGTGAAFGVAQGLSSGTTDPTEFGQIVSQSILMVGVLGAVTSGVIPVTKEVFKKTVEIKGRLKSDLIEKGYTSAEAEQMANHGGYVGGVPKKSTNEIRADQTKRVKSKNAREEQIYKLETEISMAEEALSSEKAAKLDKYASNKGMKRSLPEMTGEKGQGTFKQTGDQLAEQAGFKDIYEADMAYGKYSQAKEILKDKKAELKDIKDQFKAEKQVGKLEAMEEFKALKDEEAFLKELNREVKKDLKTMTDINEKILYDVKTGILKAIEQEKIKVRKDILTEKVRKKLDNTVLLRFKEKEGIENWRKATKPQLEAVLEDVRSLKDGDKMLSLTQVETLKELGATEITTKREAADILGDITKWKDKKMYVFETIRNFFKTMDQKINNTAGKDADLVKTISTRPREKAVNAMFHEEITLKGEMRKMLDEGRINNPKDRGRIMEYGEGRMTLEELKTEAPKKWESIVEADKWFRKQYDNLFEKANTELSRFYDDSKLIPKRKDYYTHFQEIGKIWEDQGAISGEINPVIERVAKFTKANRKFNPFGLKREGGMEFVEDAGRAFEAYLGPTLHNIHMTETVIRHRAIADVLANKTIETKSINSFIRSIDKAADNLAGQMDPFSKAVSDVVGKTFVKNISKYTNIMGKNKILGNIGSAIMQISGIPTSSIRNGLVRTANGLLKQGLSPLLGKNDPILKSDWWKRRYGEKGIQHGETMFPKFLGSEKLGKVEMGAENIAAIPFELIEKNVTAAIWRASFDNAYSQGFRGADLIAKADEIAGSTVGSRSIGEKAQAFESGILSLPLQFQLEVNTLAQTIGEDVFGLMGKEPIKSKGTNQLKAIHNGINGAISLYLLNTFFQGVSGRSPLPDPIRMMQDVGEADTYVEKVGRIVGEGLSSVAGGQLIANIYPWSPATKKKVFGRSEVGIYPGGIPVMSAIQNDFTTPINLVYDFVMPFGGAQLKKIVEGISALNKKGSYNKQGNLQFPITSDQWLKVVTFGRYSTPEAQEYFNKQRLPLTDNMTILYNLRTQAGEDPQKVYDELTAERRLKELNAPLIKEVTKLIKENYVEGLALLSLWVSDGTLSESEANKIINEIEKK